MIKEGILLLIEAVEISLALCLQEILKIHPPLLQGRVNRRLG